MPVIGGYLGLDAGPTGGTMSISNPDGFPQLTVFSGNIGNGDAMTDNCYNVVHAPDPSLQLNQELERVTVTGGYADGPSLQAVDYQTNGGGIHSARLVGGGTRLRLEECIFTDNYAEEGGGAAFFAGVSDDDQFFGAVKCFVQDNEAGERGGGFSIDRLGAEVSGSSDYGSYVMNCSFFDNTAGALAQGTGGLTDAGGGAVWIDGLQPVVTFQMSNNRVAGNTVRGRGAAYAFADGADGALSVANDTIYNNTVTENNGGEAPAAVSFASSFPQFSFFRNNIVFGNRGALQPGAPMGVINLFENGGAGSRVTTEHNDIEVTSGSPVYPGTGNISQKPLFVDVLSRDFRLQDTSPCVDAGVNSGVNLDLGDIDNNLMLPIEVLPLDFRANANFPRIVNIVDMGAFEQ